ncbi:unnamed protein product [Paramecium sonneborni]|uniref:Uncharacterized protein n=1 Tax=Paramecium sonneborni TaxID=65129 RepID=A0A8S1PST3_9CILI|nr:unnamed protein product [Paramecium sonneborni]
MKYLIIIGLLLLVARGQLYNVKKCSCGDVKTEINCKGFALSKCIWQGAECVDYKSPTDGGDTSAKSLYCLQFMEGDCAKKRGCSWVEKACTHFTGCTAFKLDTFESCQAISRDCITDGIQCVAIDFCNTYITELSCLQSPPDRFQCFWDGSNCLNADKCEYLPTTYTSDKECREAIKTCTVHSKGYGCVTSASTCYEQLSKDQCVYDFNMVRTCFWNDEWATDEYQCRDYTCDEAPKSLSTYTQCNDFGKENKLANLNCTAKKGGGCQVIKNCEDNQIKSACEYNSAGAKCIWDKKKFCILLNCEAGPASLTTNEQCQDFVKIFTSYKCITKSGGGCVSNINCNSATIQSACKFDGSSRTCFWDDTVTPNLCKELTCDNLPKTYKTAKECSDKIIGCTLASSKAGCTAKSCNKAPTDTTDCEAYLPNNNCVPKKDGGCQSLGDCQTILQANCDTKKNKSGVTCFWDGSACKEQICANLTGSTYSDHSACNTKIPTCTVKTGGNGCEDWKCENSFKDDNCTWKGGKCFQKECYLASTLYNSHVDCNEYLNSCTFSLEKTPVGGCASITLRCEDIFNERACQYKKTIKANGKVVYVKCGWDGAKCIDQSCTTLSKTFTTTRDCNQEGRELNSNAKNCVSNNPNASDEILGCIPLPSSCKDRKTLDNCPIKYGNIGPDCVWVPQDGGTGFCLDKACTTAHLDGSTSQVTTNNCKSYMPTCIANNDNTQCINKPPVCNSIINPNNCEDDAKINGHCIWNDSCKDKNCINLPSSYDTHEKCYTATKIDKQCTVNSDATGCIPLKANCADYQDKEKQCFITIDGKKCFFQGTCRDLTCADIDRTSSYDSHSECNTRLDTCTVVQVVGTQCTSKFRKCSDYAISSNCVITSTGADCVWDGTICSQKSLFDCTLIKLDAYSNENCAWKFSQCRANGDTTGCIIRTCADYSATAEGAADDVECSNQDSICTSTKSDGLPCQTRQDSCSIYTSDATCTVAKEGTCKFANAKCFLATASCSSLTVADATDDKCVAFRDFCKKGEGDKTCTAKLCSDFIKGDGDVLTDDICQSYDSTCKATVAAGQGETAVVAGAACYQLKIACAHYIDGNAQASCKVKASGKKCFWDSTGPGSCKDIANSTCFLITAESGLTKNACQEYDTSCTANRDGTACIQITTDCANNQIQNCVERFTGLCVQNQVSNFGAYCKNLIRNTACNLIYFEEYKYTDTKCNSLNALCTANDVGTACIDRTCNNAATNYSFAKCNEWLSTCTWNKKTDGTAACTVIKDKCGDQTTEATCFQAKEGECAFVDGKCKLLDCMDKTGSNDECNIYSSKCALSNPGGCQEFTVNCSDYKQEQQCYKTSTNKECFWNATIKTCVELSCDKIEQSASYSSHNQCNNLTNNNSKTLKCTVRSNSDDSGSGYGCIALSHCGSYKIKDQCQFDTSHSPCEWVVTDKSSTCVNKTCNTADNTYNTHNSCLSYYQLDSTKYSCTVKAVKSDNPSDPPIVGGGCIPLAACSTTYQSEENCQVNDQQGPCGWNGEQCADKSCSTAQPTFTDHVECYYYFNNKCTVAETLKGCIELPATCEELNKVEQCYINQAQEKCYWDGEKCITPTCENAPQSFINDSQCGDYNKICTQDNTIPCKTLVCEDFLLTTDDACKEKLKICKTDVSCVYTCTTDGTKCVLRKQCNQALYKNACVTDISDNKCQWDSEKNLCDLMTCSTAPVTEYTTDELCYNYYIPGKCMLKADAGGCTDRTVCTQIKTYGACTSSNGDSQKTKCIWDNGSCRYQNCIDFTGTSHAECQRQFKVGDCTVGNVGKCVAVQDCEKTTVQAACVKGLNGPCLWISGACYPYTKCESLTWLKDNECKAISPKCTTNGTKCVSITSCEQTNITGGCQTGYDGQCILNKTATGKACKKRDKGCIDAAFSTWKECSQEVNTSCSTDGVTCIELQECKDYKVEDACINNRSKTAASKSLTGKCNWDGTNKTCHDEKCAELVSNTTTNFGCSSQLSSCTSNGYLMLLVMLHLILIIIHVSLKQHQPLISILLLVESKLVLISKLQNALQVLQELFLVFLMELYVFLQEHVLLTKLKLHATQVKLMELSVYSLHLLMLDLLLVLVHVLK